MEKIRHLQASRHHHHHWISWCIIFSFAFELTQSYTYTMTRTSRNILHNKRLLSIYCSIVQTTKSIPMKWSWPVGLIFNKNSVFNKFRMSNCHIRNLSNEYIFFSWRICIYRLSEIEQLTVCKCIEFFTLFQITNNKY